MVKLRGVDVHDQFCEAHSIMTDNGRIRGIAEMGIVHRDANGTVLRTDRVKTPVTYRLSPDGSPTDIRPGE